MDKSNVIETIIKLAGLADANSNTFQGEIAAASSKIQELMDKYAISQAEVNAAIDQSKTPEPIEYSSIMSEYDEKGAHWHWALAKVIARATHTRHYRMGYKMTFFGSKENATIASGLFSLWVIQINEMAKQALKKYRSALVKGYYTGQKNFYSQLPKNLQPKYYRISWIDGCISGMDECLSEQENERANETSKALVIIDQNLAEAYLELAKTFKRVSSGRPSGFNALGYKQGKEVGRKVYVASKPIESGK